MSTTGPSWGWNSEISAVADRLLAPVLLLGSDSTLQYMNPAAAHALNATPERLVGRQMLDLIHPEDRPRAAREFLDVAAGLVPGGVSRYRVRAHPKDPWRTFETMADNLLDDPNVGGILLSARDVTDQLTHEASLYVAAYRDSLTGLPNRAEINQQLAALVHAGEPLAVAFIGLDRFKLINDSLGHSAGDDVLRVVSSRLVESLPGAAIVGRFGADVFVVLVPGPAASQARALVWRSVERVMEPLFLSGHELQLASSAGIAHRDAASTADSLLRDADLALHQSKVAGGGRVELFEPALREVALARLELEADLRRAIARHDLTLALQPIVRLENSEAVGAEVLVRWHRPDGSVEPSQFIEVAEQTGLIVPLGDWIINEAAQLAPGAPAGHVTVNLSARQLASPGLPRRIARALKRHQLEPASIDFEVTESLVITQFEYVVDVLTAIRALGCRVGLDDFGTGYSSLGYLRRLPIDFLKLDGSLIEGVDHDSQARAIVGAVVTMADALGLSVVAECVETAEQAEALVAVGCEYAQGFYFAHPSDA